MPKARTASFGFLVEIIKSEKIYFLKHIPRTPLIPTWTSPSHEAGRPGVRPDPTLRFDLGGSLGLVLLSSVYPTLVTGNRAYFYALFFFSTFLCHSAYYGYLLCASSWGPGGSDTVEKQDWNTEVSGSDGLGLKSCHLMHDLGQVA